VTIESIRTVRDEEYGKRLYHELLVIRAKRGDHGAFDEIVRELERPIFYYVRRLVGSDEDAWDLTQEVWVKAFRGIGSLRETRRFRVWLYSIAHHVVMSHHRAAYRNQAGRDETLVLDSAIEAEPIPNPEDAERVHLALDQLDPVFREVLTLRFLEDLSVDETAEIIGVPSGTVKSRLFHAKKALKNILSREEKI
jgi:RNA polymerase sigma-70 factor (ECF subfamily)